MNEDDISYEEWALSEIIGHPVLFREFINEDDPNWSPLEKHERAWSTCSNPFVAMCCGRGVHKTTTMIEMLYYWVINGMFVPGDPGLFIMVPNKAQKDLTFFRIRSACLSHWLIRQWVMPNNINISEGKIEFKNGFQLWMRIAGAAGSDNNVIGVHTYRIWVDEAQEFPWQTWQSLQNCLKVEVNGYQMLVSGVPNGERLENVLYYADQESEKYISFNIATANMSWWTPEMEYEKRQEYHATFENSEDYKHYVLGQHGVPSFNIFDRVRFVKNDEFETQKFIYSQDLFDRSRRLGENGYEYHIEEVIQAPMIPENLLKNNRIGLGYDVGFNPDPAVFFIMYEHEAGVWRNLVRIILNRVEYPIQRKVLEWLDQVYGFNFLGIDMGGVGRVQFQDIMSEGSEYHERFKNRLYPVEFGGYKVVAITEDGTEKKDQLKRVLVESLSKWVHSGRFEFSSKDTDLMAELERTKFTRTITGEPVYRTENDHQMAAFMCAIEAFDNRYGEPVILKPKSLNLKLIAAEWLYDLGGD